MSAKKTNDTKPATAQQKAVTGTKGTKGDAKAVITARIAAFDEIAEKSAFRHERNAAKVHAAMLRDVLKEIF